MIEIVASEFSKNKKSVENLIALHQDGNTVPFIARYRKEMTGGMEAEDIRNIIERFEYLVALEKRKEEVLAAIDEKGKLTDELKKAILDATTMKDLEDLYAPYKSKKKTKADIAREAGLQPLADWIKENDDLSALDSKCAEFIGENVESAEIALEMAKDIITEEIGHDPDTRTRIRELYHETGVLACSKRKDVTERTSYEDYYEFEQKAEEIPPHRVLAIFRGEREKILRVKINPDEEKCMAAILRNMGEKGIVQNDVTMKCASASYRKTLSVSAELDLRATLKDKGEEKAIEVFANNLKSLLLTPRVSGRVILGIDPAFRTGCKFAVVNDMGGLLDYGVIYPTKPQADYEGSRRTVTDMVRKYGVNSIVIGNGTASRETEEFVASVIEDSALELSYAIVSEAGASVYSAGSIAQKEFPDLDVSIRGAVSIARRVIDPLAELVKIEPRSIGVGMYQHDVNPKRLGESLENVVEDVVNSVGVDLNTASVSLLQYVAGLSRSLAERIVSTREKLGKFMSRKQLMEVEGIGEQTFKQCAGFLKVYDGEEPMDSMFIHPESYESAYLLLKKLNVSLANSELIKLALRNKNMKGLGKELDLGEFTLEDIIESLEKPDRDIRDDLDPLLFKKGVVNLEQLKAGMVLDGKVTNVVDFGAFVDIGLKNDGLVHISRLADRFVKHPSDIVSVGDNVKVRVLEVDKERGRVSLSMN
ncbi:Tex family protein [Limisalsivibrio acetivorans]|uniref:Tex family protein n=1 Tax=Limisalsivibrio acetivorans TaxID=1304888 RepID=UPI0003B3B8AC|nr:Tex family protein [Limisalsivibrio acetivorans]